MEEKDWVQYQKKNKRGFISMKRMRMEDCEEETSTAGGFLLNSLQNLCCRPNQAKVEALPKEDSEVPN